jgi:hypothetical protein
MSMLRQFFYLALLILAASVVCAVSTKLALASDPPKPQATTPDPLAAAEQQARLAKLEAEVLREQTVIDSAMKPVAAQLEKIRSTQQTLFLTACKAAGLEPDPKVCQIDFVKLANGDYDLTKAVTKRAVAGAVGPQGPTGPASPAK